jgi:sulfur carrier protein
MELLISGQKKNFDDGLTIAELLEVEKVDNPLYVTVSVNEQFVEREALATKTLKDGDQIEFLYFMGGGC